jgi:SNF2 family DNA or RNA helicase
MTFERQKKETDQNLFKSMKEYLEDAEFVAVDEGHKIKNDKTQLSISMNLLKTRMKVGKIKINKVLTGTPLQNNLM